MFKLLQKMAMLKEEDQEKMAAVDYLNGNLKIEIKMEIKSKS